MNNRIIYIKKGDVSRELSQLSTNSLKIIIDGTKVRKRADFFYVIEKELQFPGTCNCMFARFDDWICDLSWFSSELSILIYIKNYALFLDEDLDFKKNLMEDFSEDILTFWESDVLRVVKNGKTRNFNIIVEE